MVRFDIDCSEEDQWIHHKQKKFLGGLRENMKERVEVISRCFAIRYIRVQ